MTIGYSFVRGWVNAIWRASSSDVAIAELRRENGLYALNKGLLWNLISRSRMNLCHLSFANRALSHGGCAGNRRCQRVFLSFLIRFPLSSASLKHRVRLYKSRVRVAWILLSPSLLRPWFPACCRQGTASEADAWLSSWALPRAICIACPRQTSRFCACTALLTLNHYPEYTIGKEWMLWGR